MPAILALSSQEIAFHFNQNNIAADTDNVLPGQDIILFPPEKAEEAGSARRHQGDDAALPVIKFQIADIAQTKARVDVDNFFTAKF